MSAQKQRRVMVNMTMAEYKIVQAEAKKQQLTLSTILMRPWRHPS